MLKKPIFIASDHAGFALKDLLINQLAQHSFHLTDLGTSSLNPVDYPDYANLAAQAILQQPESMAILICGSGIGMSIAANRFEHVRAALCHDEHSAHLSRQHNNANVIVLGARFIEAELALKIILQFLNTEFEGGRHQQRIDKLSLKRSNPC